MAINGISEDEAVSVKDKPSTHDDETKEQASSDKDVQDDDSLNGSEGKEPQEEPLKQPGAENGECRLLGPFALIVQGGLGFLALLSLVWKRWRERPRRPVKVWFFDASKQVVGSVLLHLLNVLVSMVSSEDYELANKAKQIQDGSGREPNPCSFYLINIAVDVSVECSVYQRCGSCNTNHARPRSGYRSWSSF